MDDGSLVLSLRYTLNQQKNARWIDSGGSDVVVYLARCYGSCGNDISFSRHSLWDRGRMCARFSAAGGVSSLVEGQYGLVWGRETTFAVGKCTVVGAGMDGNGWDESGGAVFVVESTCSIWMDCLSIQYRSFYDSRRLILPILEDRLVWAAIDFASSYRAEMEQSADHLDTTQEEKKPTSSDLAR